MGVGFLFIIIVNWFFCWECGCVGVFWNILYNVGGGIVVFIVGVVFVILGSEYW